MNHRLPLSTLAALIQETIEETFFQSSFWVIAEITDVKKMSAKRWCFLKFIEKKKEQIVTELQGVFWSNAYSEIEKFEAKTQQAFASGIEISCRVMVRFHPRYGLKLEVQEIDPNYSLGQMELQRQHTLDRLLKLHSATVQLVDDEYITFNKKLTPAPVLQRVALVSATNSDGNRDFVQELTNNRYGFIFHLTAFPASVQGQSAVAEICDQLDAIKLQANQFDVVVIVRGGGSDVDLTPFDHFDMAYRIASFPIPVFTGIGHDRNTSIADLMGWQWRTPSKAAAAIVDTALQADMWMQKVNNQLQALLLQKMRDYQQQLAQWNSKLQFNISHRITTKKDRLKDYQHAIALMGHEKIRHSTALLDERKQSINRMAKSKVALQKILLGNTKNLVEKLSPESILNRGFAIVMQSDTIVTDATHLQAALPLQTVLKNATIQSEIKKVISHE